MPSNKLLYILPDVTYFAELLPTKKEFTFAVQSFRQVNGEFLDDTEFLPENVDKLFSKFKGESFTSLILPDFLFTDTIVSVKETDEKAVIVHLKEKLLPSLGLTTDSHYVNTFVLNQFKGESKVQISAIEKSLLAPIRVSAKNHDVSFEGVTALSWSAKSIISLEPSISILQVGSKLYSSLHYIGIDQTTVAELDEISNIIETIKTLKGGEPSIQTIYLLSNAIVEEELTDKLKSILPIQQLASFKEEDAKMPSYIKYIIESGMKTLSIPDYLAPSFEIEKATAEDEKTIEALTQGAQERDTEEDSEEVETKDTNTTDTLPTPTLPDASATTTAALSQIKHLDLSVDTSNISIEEQNQTDTKDELASVEVKPEEPETSDENSKIDSNSDTLETKEPDTNHVEESKSTSKVTEPEEDTEMSDEIETTAEEKELSTDSSLYDADSIDLRKFSIDGGDTTKSETAKNSKKTSNVIKNSSGVGTMMKMVFITLAVFFATVAVGVGVGLGLLKVTQQDTQNEATPVVVETQSPEPEATESAEIQEIVKFDPTTGYSVLIVNATTKAGYAGTIKTDLTDADFDDVDAANAKGEYEEGNFILVDEEMPGLKEYIEKATNLTFELDLENKEQEDTASAYDFVIVLSE